MPSLAETFVEVTGDFDPLVQDAQQQGEEAGTRAGSAFNDRMKMAVVAGAAAIGAGLVVGLQGAIAQSAGQGLLAAQLGASPQEAQRLGSLAGKLYAGGFGASMEDVNAALRAVVQNGIVGLNSTDAEIQRVAGNVTNLAALLGEDADRVSAAVSQMLRTGMAKSAEEAFDILAAASQKGINKAQDLLDTTNEYSTQFRKLGLDGTTAFGLISQAIQGGARDSDVAADALKEFSIRATDGSAEAAASFTALGLNAKEMTATFAKGGPEAAAALDVVLDRLRKTEGRADAAQIAFGLFGTQSEDLGKALYSMDLSGAANQLGKVEGAAAAAGKTMAGSAAGQVDVFKRAVEQGLINATAKAIPYLMDLGGWINRNREWLIPLATTIGTVVAAVWLVNTATAAWTATVAALNAVHLISGVRLAATTAATVVHTAVSRGVAIATNLWAVAQWALNTAFLASPFGLVVAGIALLIGAIVLAYKNSETFRNIVDAVWRGVQVAIGAVVNWFTGTIWPSLRQTLGDIGGAFQFMWGVVKAVWDGYMAYLNFVYSNVKRFVFDPLMDLVTNKIPHAFRSGVDLVKFWWGLLTDFAKAPVRFVIETVVNKGIIGTFNAVAGFLPGVPKIGTVPLPPGFARGGVPYEGVLPGPPSDVDNMLADSPHGPVALAGGEYVVRARETRKPAVRRLLDWINGGRLGLADGGFFGLLSNPGGWIRDRVDGLIDRIPGGGSLAQIGAGMGRKLVGGLVDYVKGKLDVFGGGEGGGGAAPGFPPWPRSPGAQRGDSGVWRSILALVRSAGIPYTFGNAYRHGDPLYHGSGRAVDFMGYNLHALGRFFMARLPSVLELIHTTNDGNYYASRGKRRTSMGRQDALHRNHLHVAMAEGGLLDYRVADDGGWLAPGWNPPVYNGTGKPEAMIPDGMSVELGERTLRALVDALVRALTAGASSARQLGRAY